MRDRLILVLVFGVTICAHDLAFGLSTPGGPDEPSQPTYHSTVSEVRVAFFATDGHNHPVEVLQKSDFAVVDNDMVIRDFRSLTRSTSMKLDIIVLFDSSESVRPYFKQELTDVLQLISQSPWNAEDNVSVLSFSGTEVHPVCAGNCNSLTADKVASQPSGGSTPLFDALDTATSLLSRRGQPDVWPVIILFSDGNDTISMSSYLQALEKVLTSGVQVYAVDVGDPRQMSNGTATLQMIADASGGRFVRVSDGAARIFEDVIEDLHSARIVTYALPESSSEFHSIRILPTHNLNLQFRCRHSYYHRSGRTD